MGLASRAITPNRFQDISLPFPKKKLTQNPNIHQFREERIDQSINQSMN
jgi:hypothetical protein